MPHYHLFQFKIKPAIWNEHYARISGGSAAVLVKDDDPKKALKIASDYLTKGKWEILKIEIFPPSSEEKQSEHAELNEMQKQANAKGIGCTYYLGVGGGDIMN